MKEYKKKDYRKEAIKQSKSHWEMDVKGGDDEERRGMKAWNPKPPGEWPRPYKKVNDCDY